MSEFNLKPLVTSANAQMVSTSNATHPCEANLSWKTGRILSGESAAIEEREDEGHCIRDSKQRVEDASGCEKKERTTRMALHQILPLISSNVGRGALTLILPTYVVQHYTHVVGVSLTATTSMMALTLFTYALPQHFLGMLQDRNIFKHGRRKPWIAASGTITLLCFLIITCVPNVSVEVATRWGMLISVLLGPAWGCLDATYDSLCAESTFDYADRIRLLSYSTALLGTGVVLGGFLYGILGTSLDVANARMSEEYRMRMLGIVCSFSLVAGIFVTLVFNREYLSTVGDPPNKAAVSKEEKESCDARLHPPRTSCVTRLSKHLQSRIKMFSTGFCSFFYNRPALIIMPCMGLGLMSAVTSALLLNFFSIYIVKSTFLANWLALLIAASAVASSLLWVVVVKKVVFLQQKGFSYTLSLGLIALSQLLSSLLVHEGDEFLFAILSVGGQGVGAGGTLVSSLAMKPDVIDYEEFRTGVRREGQFMGMFLLFSKLFGAAGSLAVMAVLQLSGFHPNEASNYPQNLFALRVCYCAVSITCTTLLALLIYHYPINAKNHEEIIQSTDIRLSGGYASDPLYGGDLLPPYKCPKLNASVESFERTTTSLPAEVRHQEEEKKEANSTK